MTSNTPFHRIVSDSGQHLTPARKEQHVTYAAPTQASTPYTDIHFHHLFLNSNTFKRSSSGHSNPPEPKRRKLESAADPSRQMTIPQRAKPDPGLAKATKSTDPKDHSGDKSNLLSTATDGTEPQVKQVLASKAKISWKGRAHYEGHKLQKPIQAAVYEDVFDLILRQCPPSFLREAQLVCKGWYKHLNDHDKIWNQSRLNFYGDDMPVPPNMTEKQYAFLLEGFGCITCKKPTTEKTFWVFRARWCAECFQVNTIKEAAARTMLTVNPMLLECIPCAMTFGGKYKFGRAINQDGWNQLQSNQGGRFAITEVTSILQEYRGFVAQETSEDKIQEFVDMKKAQNIDFMTKVKDVERWQMGQRALPVKHRRERETYFTKCSNDLTPPMSARVLRKTLSFKEALDSNRKPNDAQWRILKPKVESQRNIAEELVRVEDVGQRYKQGLREPEMTRYLSLHHQRQFFESPEQCFVLMLADRAMAEVDKKSVADCDYALLILNTLYRMYYATDQATRPRLFPADTANSPYKLVLDDAKMVFNRKIMPRIDSWQDSKRTKAAAHSFKCPGCKRKDHLTPRSFVKLFEHIAQKHSWYTTDFHILAKPIPVEAANHSFPWYSNEWPPNLPVLADHHKATGDWDPEDQSVYAEHETKPTSSNTSAFEGRVASSADAPGNKSFVENVLHAAAKLKTTDLPPIYQTLIVLQYAHDRYGVTSEITSLPLQFIEEAYQAANQQGYYHLFHRFICGVCSQNPTAAISSTFARRTQEFGDLLTHWRNRHLNSSLFWIVDLMALPTPIELYDQLQSNHAARQAFDELFLVRTELFPSTS